MTFVRFNFDKYTRETTRIHRQCHTVIYNVKSGVSITCVIDITTFRDDVRK